MLEIAPASYCRLPLLCWHFCRLLTMQRESFPVWHTLTPWELHPRRNRKLTEKETGKVSLVRCLFRRRSIWRHLWSQIKKENSSERTMIANAVSRCNLKQNLRTSTVFWPKMRLIRVNSSLVFWLIIIIREYIFSHTRWKHWKVTSGLVAKLNKGAFPLLMQHYLLATE